jgi:hypothetical protein
MSTHHHVKSPFTISEMQNGADCGARRGRFGHGAVLAAFGRMR